MVHEQPKSSKTNVSGESDKSDETECHIQKLPLEIITKILKQLSVNDIITLTNVSKIWRCKFLNQNTVWKDVCEKLDIREEHYLNCLSTMARSNYNCKGYIDITSESFFGPYCKWWLIYCRYNMIIKNIKNNDFPTFRVDCGDVDQSFCTDDYIINVYRLRENPVEILILKGSDMPNRNEYLNEFDLLSSLLRNKTNSLKIIGNKKFLVFEIHSVIFVYSNENGEFVTKFQKVINNSVESDVAVGIPGLEFLQENNNKIDICDDKLALIDEYKHKVLVIDLISEEIVNEFEYNIKENARHVVDCIKFANRKLSIGLTITNIYTIRAKYKFIVYQLDKGTDDNRLVVPVMGTITQFKVMKNYIGVQNKGRATPFVKEVAGKLVVFWIECDTFSFDVTRNCIYYNVNQNVFRYGLGSSRADNYEGSQKIAGDAISDLSNLTPINDRFLLVRSIFLNAYSIFDVVEGDIIWSIQLNSGFTAIHVGKLYIVFSNTKEYLIVSFV